jgi:hypothetical protein
LCCGKLEEVGSEEVSPQLSLSVLVRTVRTDVTNTNRVVPHTAPGVTPYFEVHLKSLLSVVSIQRLFVCLAHLCLDKVYHCHLCHQYLKSMQTIY